MVMGDLYDVGGMVVGLGSNIVTNVKLTSASILYSYSTIDVIIVNRKCKYCEVLDDQVL